MMVPLTAILSYTQDYEAEHTYNVRVNPKYISIMSPEGPELQWTRLSIGNTTILVGMTIDALESLFAFHETGGKDFRAGDWIDTLDFRRPEPFNPDHKPSPRERWGL